MNNEYIKWLEEKIEKCREEIKGNLRNAAYVALITGLEIGYMESLAKYKETSEEV